MEYIRPEEEVKSMESYMTTYRKEGQEETKLEDIRNLMDSEKWSAERAMDALNIPEADRDRYLTQLEEKQGM